MATGVVSGLLSATAPSQIVVQACPFDTAAQTASRRSRPCLRTLTAPNGRFTFIGVEPGFYLLEALVDGKRLMQTMEVEAGAVIEPVLQAAPAKTSAGAAAATAASGSADGTTSPELPLEGLGWEQQARTEADVHVSADEQQTVAAHSDEDRAVEQEARENGGGSGVSVRGIGEQQSVEAIDGLSAGERFRGGNRGNGLLGRSGYAGEAINRFRVAEAIPGAMFGGGAGGLLVATTASGRETFHGGASVLLAGSALAASDPYALVQRFQNGVATSAYQKPGDFRLSGTLHGGGSLSRNRDITGFAAFEGALQKRTIVSSPRDPGFYSLTSTQTGLLANRGVSVSAVSAALAYLDSLSGPSVRTSSGERVFLRSDYMQSAASSFAVSFAQSLSTGPAGIAALRSVVPRGRASIGVERNSEQTLWGQWTLRFHTGVVNTLRAQLTDVLESEQPDAPLAAEPAIGPGGFAPQVRIASEFSYGTPSALGRQAFPDEQRFEVADSAVLSWRQHVLSWGVDVTRIREQISATQNSEGTFAYDSGVTNGKAGGLVDWITDATFNVNAYPNGGCPAIFAAVHDFCFRSFTQSFGEGTISFPLGEIAAYAQDHWRARSDLAIDYGVRYEYTLLPVPQTPNAALDAIFSAQGATSIFPEDRNNVAPRLSVAYSPHRGSWGTVHAGMGAFYGRLPGSDVRAALANTALPSSVSRIRITPETVTVCPQTPSVAFGYPCAYTVAPPGVVLQTGSALVFSRRFRSPAVLRANFAWQRDVHGVAAEIAYSGALAVQLPNTADINIAASTGVRRFQLQGGTNDGETFVVPAYTARVTSAFGPVTMLASNANSTFHALRLRVSHRGTFAWRASYTWSKALDYGPDYGAEPRSNGQFDPFTVAYDKGHADADFPQQFAGDVVWRTRLTHGRPILAATLSGWRMGLIATAGSGRPYSYEIFGGTALSGGATSINGAGGSVYLPTVGRNTLHLPMRWSADVRLARDFRLFQKLRGEGAFTVFNVANHLNPASVNTRAFLVGTAVNGTTPLVFQDAATVATEGLPAASTFGRIVESGAGIARERRAQVEIRIRW